MPVDPKDYRYEAFSTGWEKKPLRLTHKPTGIVILAEPGDTKVDLFKKLDAALAQREQQ